MGAAIAPLASRRTTRQTSHMPSTPSGDTYTRGAGALQTYVWLNHGSVAESEFRCRTSTLTHDGMLPEKLQEGMVHKTASQPGI